MPRVLAQHTNDFSGRPSGTKQTPIQAMPTCWWQHILDKDEDGFLWAQLDALTNNVHELAYSKV